LLYIGIVIKLTVDDNSVDVLAGSPADHETIAIFGASGTAGVKFRKMKP
jgi:hypothetical protein